MRKFANSAVETELLVSPGLSGGSITVADSTGYPVAPFTVLLDPDVTTEEIVLVTAVSGNTWEVTRGWGGTTAVSHDAGAKVRHGAVSQDFTEAAMAFDALFGDATYTSGQPTNTLLIPVTDYVRKSAPTWGDLL